MTAAAHMRQAPRAAVQVPHDVASAGRLAGWRGGFRWPVAPEAAGRQSVEAVRRMLALADGAPEEAKLAAVAAFPLLMTFSTAVVEAALCAQAEREGEVRVISAEPEFAFLRGDSDAPPTRLQKHVARIDKPRLPLRRSLQVTSSWATGLALAGAALAPEAVAASVNGLLGEAARSSGRRIWFRHAGGYLARARSLGRPSSVDSAELALRLAECWLADMPVDEDIRTRGLRLIQANCLAMLPTIAGDLAGLRGMARLPKRLWSGSAGNYQVRALSLEVRRRGGEVVRFDHGGTTGMTLRPATTAAVELHGASRFVMPTAALARALESSGALEALGERDRPRIEGGPGERRLLRLPLYRRRPLPARPRVVYAPTVLSGFARYLDAPQPDAMVLDWTLRVVEALRALPIDLLCKPHPEGVFARRAHPVADLAPTSYRRFEEEIEAADVFVFDRCYSTAFWEAVCTDRTVVYLPAAPIPLHPEIEPLFRARCRTVGVSWDDRNLPVFDARELADAVLGDLALADPGPFQDLLIGRRAT